MINKRIFFLSWIIIFICFIPVFLAFYPAIMSYDFYNQSVQAFHGPPYFTDHHPVTHTLLIWIAFRIGYALNSLELGMAFYSVLQMLILSGASAYLTEYIYSLLPKGKAKILAIIAVLSFYALFVYNALFSVTVTKDVMFGAFFSIFFVMLAKALQSDRTISFKHSIPLVFFGWLTVIFRNNAIYAVAVLFAVSLIFLRKSLRIRLAIILAVVIIGGKLIMKTERITLAHYAEDNIIEMLAVPIQQLGRIGKYHGTELSDEEYDMLTKFVDEASWDWYTPSMSNLLKLQVLGGTFQNWRTDKSGFVRTWVYFLKKYPNEYIGAYVDLYKAFFLLGEHAFYDSYHTPDPETGFGIFLIYNASETNVMPEGIQNISYFPALRNYFANLVCGLKFYNIPILWIFFMPAAYTWILLLSSLCFLATKNYKKLLLSVLPLAYGATLMLGPLVDIRYIFNIMLVCPILIVWTVISIKGFIKSKNA